MSITQGGYGFPFLAPAVYCYISTGRFNTPEADDIPDGMLKFAVEKVAK
jgi:hypothetical protein